MLSLLLVSASLYAAAPNAGAPVRVHGGTVMVKSRTHATIFLVRTGDGDGPAEHLFQIWSNPGLALDGVYRGTDVEYTGTTLTLTVPSARSVTTYAVAGRKAPAVPVPEGFAAMTYEVFGLNHQTGVDQFTISTGHANGRISANDCTDCGGLTFEDPWGAAGSGTGCNAGGAGSTSCSISYGGSSCSVSCSSGYACCRTGDPPSCTCVAN